MVQCDIKYNRINGKIQMVIEWLKNRTVLIRILSSPKILHTE